MEEVGGSIPTRSTRNALKSEQLGARFHGMEEVVGSIPTRSTKNARETTLYILQSKSGDRFYAACILPACLQRRKWASQASHPRKNGIALPVCP